MIVNRRKTFEFLFLFLLSSIYYFFFPSPEHLIIFCLGYIWNWSTSTELTEQFQNRRYRFSMLKTAINFQNLLVRPFLKAPEFAQRLIKSLPAGIFWWGVTYINNSQMPWWSAFIGSLCFEVLQLELSFIREKKKDL